MLPRDLIQRYGMPIVRRLTNITQGTLLAGESYDRYSITFLTNVGAISIRTRSNSGTVNQFFDVNPNILFTLHHLTHGLLPNLAFEADSDSPGTLLTVYESLAYDFGQLRPLESHAINSKTNRKHKSPTPFTEYLLRPINRKGK